MLSLLHPGRNLLRKCRTRTLSPASCAIRSFWALIASSLAASPSPAPSATSRPSVLSTRATQRLSSPRQTSSASRSKITTISSCLAAMVSLINLPIPRLSRQAGSQLRKNSPTEASQFTRIVAAPSKLSLSHPSLRGHSIILLW